MADESRHYDQWQLPVVEGTISNAKTIRPTQMARQDILQQLKAQAIKEGYQEGITQGQQEINTRVQALNQLLMLLEKPCQLIDEKVEQWLLQMVILITKQCNHQSLTINPKIIEQMIQAALDELITIESNCRLELHPADKKHLEETAHEIKKLAHCTVIENSTLSRGEFILQSDSIDIDARIQQRLSDICDESTDATSSTPT